MNTKDKIQNGIEYMLSGLWILSALSLIGAPPLEAPGVIVLVLGGQVALYVYMVWFAILGLGMFWAKVANKPKLHKYMLLSMYLTPVYTACLVLAVFGLDIVSIIDDIVLGVLAAGCFLRHKFKTEYVDLNHVTELP